MSVAAEILKYPILRIARARVHRHAAKVIEVPPPRWQPDAAIVSLVRQLFYPGNGSRRTRILFAAAGRETNISGVAQRAAEVLAEISGAAIAIVERSADVLPVDADDPPGPASPVFWRRYGVAIHDRLWRLKTDVLPLLADERTGIHTEFDLPFDYFVLAAQVSDSMMPLLCRNCDGAVLVVTANRTRKEAAVQAKVVLQQCNAELLGTVLDGRRFPIPESIYRRL